MRLLAAIIILTIFACAALASHQRKPFPLLVDASAPLMPGVMVCKPLLIPRHEGPKPIVRT